jgi:glutamate decarboxylase
LRIIGRRGYQLLIDQGIEKAQAFARMIEQDDEFELVTEPELNILTYRWRPSRCAQLLEQGGEPARKANEILNSTTRYIQKAQREHGRAFVSRTRLTPERYQGQPVVVFRVVLANPLTTLEVLQDILDEQRQIATEAALAKRLQQLDRLLPETA